MIDPKKRAFSIVEFVIVAMVTSLLFSMIIPIYKTEKDRAMGNQCVVNLKKLAVTTLIYCNDWQGKFPCVNAVSLGTSSLQEALDIYIRPDLAPQIWKCPADIGDGVFGVTDAVPYWRCSGTSYDFPGLNYKSWGYPYLAGLNHNNPVPSPTPTTYNWIWDLPISRRMMIYDQACFHRLMKKGTNAKRYTANGNNNIVYCDGHVGSLDYQHFMNLRAGTSELK